MGGKGKGKVEFFYHKIKIMICLIVRKQSKTTIAVTFYV